MSRVLLRAILFTVCLVLPRQVTAAVIDAVLLPDNTTLISITGELVSSDAETFKAKISGVNKGIVTLVSDGGSLQAGIQIGTAIRLRGLITLVPEGRRCASACAIAWLGGAPRVMGRDAKIGFHAAYRMQSGEAVETGVGNALLGAYLNNLGLSENAIIYLTMAAPKSMTWLDRDQASALGIDVKSLPSSADEEELPVQSAPRPMATPPSSSLPSAGGPSRSAAPVASPELRARKFAEDYFDRLGSPDGERASYFDEVYAPSVKYYGKVVSRAHIVSEKVRFAARWPRRSYKWRTDTVSVICTSEGGVCIVEGLVDWSAKNTDTLRSAAGVASMRLAISRNGSREQITEEFSKVIERVSPDKSSSLNPVGSCTQTAIREIAFRLQDASTGKWIPDSGSAVTFMNGVNQVGYETIPAIHASRPGDPVRLCVEAIEKSCPADVPPGRTYRATNLRTGASWSLPDSTRSCWH